MSGKIGKCRHGSFLNLKCPPWFHELSWLPAGAAVGEAVEPVRGGALG